MNNIKIISAIVALCLSIGGVIYGMDTIYCKKAIVVENREMIAGNSKQIQVIRIERQINRNYERIWMLDRDFGIDCAACSVGYLQEYNRLKLDIENLKRQLHKLES